MIYPRRWDFVFALLWWLMCRNYASKNWDFLRIISKLSQISNPFLVLKTNEIPINNQTSNNQSFNEWYIRSIEWMCSYKIHFPFPKRFNCFHFLSPPYVLRALEKSYLNIPIIFVVNLVSRIIKVDWIYHDILLYQQTPEKSPFLVLWFGKLQD